MGKYNTERKHKEGQEMYKAVYHFILNITVNTTTCRPQEILQMD